MQTKLKIIGSVCPNCAAKMEHAINKLPGVEAINISFLTGKMVIEAEDTVAENIIQQAIRIVKKYEPGVEVQPA